MRRIERDQVDARARRPAPGRCAAARPGRSREPRQSVAPGRRQRRVGGLHGEQARGDIHQRRARDDDEVGAHAREARRNAFAQRPAGDEAGEADADAEHHGHAQKDRAQRPAADVLRRQADQQPTIVLATFRIPSADRTLFSEQNVAGLVDLHAQVMRAAETAGRRSARGGGARRRISCALGRLKPQHVERLLGRHAQASGAAKPFTGPLEDACRSARCSRLHAPVCSR